MQSRSFPRPIGALTTLAACLVLTACGSGSGKDKVPGTPQPTETGILFDHPVQGVNWESSGGQGGLTNADGEFDFRREELITFWIGDIDLGVAEGASFITPVEMTGSRVPTDQAATNQLVFLQSIDKDEDPTNGITVTAATREAAIGQTLDFESPNFSEEVEAVVAVIAPGNEIVSESTALLNFYLAYNDVGCTDNLDFQFPGFPTCGDGVTYDLQFSDEFDKGDRPSEENWNYDLGYGDEGWGNNEWQLYTDSPENVRVEDDNLIIQARCDVEPCGVRDGTVTSARITTQDKFEFRYGTVQARIKPPVGKAAWPAFWSLGAVFPETPWPRAGEIDYMEMHNAFSDERTTHFTMHWCDETIQAPAECTFPDGWVFDTANRSFPFSLGDDYHIFEADWDEERVVGKIDGITYFTRTIDPATMEEFQRDFFMILNVAMGGTLGSNGQPPTGEETWPQTMLVDYVRVWERQGGEEPVEDTLIDFEGPVESYDFGPTGGFGGGASSVIMNPVPEGINTSAQVVRMQKFDAETFGGSTLVLDPAAVIPAGGIVKMKVWSPRIVDVLLKFEGAVEAEVTVTHGGTGWENLSFDFGSYTGTVEGLTFIFDNGINGDAGNDPDNWTFYYDDILLPTGTDGGQPPAGGLVEDFENAPDSYDFGPDGGFGGGASSVIANPVPETINTSPQVARMQKFAAEPFGGSTLALTTPVEVPSGSDFTMKVWSPRQVEVLFKLEGGPDIEDTATHSGSGWEELTFDMGSVSGTFTGITFIFDNGTVGDAGNDPDNWTFYYDDIILVVDDTGPPPGGGPELVTDFENAPESYDFGPDAGFGGGASVVLENPVSETINTSPQVARMQKFAAEPFGGSTLALSTPLQVPSGSTFTMKVWSPRVVDVTFKLEGGPDAEGVTTHGGSGWEDLTFDVGGVAGTFTGITFIFDNGVVGDAGGDPDNWTFYYDDIFLVPDDGGPPPETPEGLVTDFEDAPESYDFGPDAGFGGGASVVLANPVSETINTSPQVARMQKFAAEPFGGSTLALSTPIEAPAGSNYTMKVWSPRAVDVTFKLEGGPDAEGVTTHGGSGWEDLTFDVGGVAGTFTGITFIFDNGIVGDAGGDPDNWTFYYDDIFVVTDDGGVEPPPIDDTLQDFEGDPASYTFSDFAGGAAAVVANPSMSGINTSAQAVQMLKFAGEPFAGSTLVLDAPVPLTEGRSYQMKVLSQREVVVTLKLEPLEQENTATHTGGNEWQELCFDFDGVAGDVTGYTLIFDNGTVGDAENDPDNWTFFYDDIVQTESCDGTVPPPGEDITDIVVDFEPEGVGQAYAWTVFENDDNPPVEFLANPAPDATNDSNTAARFIARQAGQPFAGVNTLDLPTFTLDETNSTVKIMVYKSVISDVGIKFETADLASTGELKVANTKINEWEELTFDFSGKIGEPSSTDINGFVIFPDFDARAQDNEIWFDNITFSAKDGGVEPGGLSIDFEDDGGPYVFSDFDGGVGTVIDNPDASGLNTSAKTAQMQKFAGAVFGGSTLALDAPVDFAAGEAFLMKVRALREVPVLFKLEGLNQERTATHSGSGTWEEVCLDFAGTTDGPEATAITFIFDLGVAGDAENDPDAWTFQFDDIVQTESCDGGTEPPGEGITDVVVDFEPEGTGQAYAWNVFENGDNPPVEFLANPAPDGTNDSNTAARFIARQAGQPFAGVNTVDLPTFTLDETNSTVKIMVYKSVISDVGLKFETADLASTGEIKVANTKINEWEELTFDFSGKIGEPSSTDINGFVIFPDFDARAQDNEIWFDNITFSAMDDGGVDPPPVDDTLEDFEGDPASYTFNDFEGGAAAVVANPNVSGINTSAQSGQMQKFAGAPFAGSTLALDSEVPLAADRSYKMKVLSQREVVVTLKLEPLNQEATATHGGGNEWQELCFDFSGVEGSVNGYTLIFDNGTVGDAENDPDNWTFFFDDIVQTETCGGTVPPPGEDITDIVVDFEPEGEGQAYAWTVFENGDNPPVEFLANPASDATNDSATAARFIARQAGQPFAGVNTLDLPTFTLDETNSTVKIMVYKSVVSDVGIKFETADLASTGELKVANTRINEWEELTFDFSGKIGEPSSTDITGFVIFPDFDARAQDNEVWFDNITFSGVDDGGGGPGGLAIDFEDDGGPYTFGDFGGGVASVADNPDATGINTSAKTAQMQKFAGEVFGGSTLTLDAPVDFGAGEAFLMKVRAQRVVPVLFKFEGLNQERTSSHGGSGTWESLCFDFTGTTTGPDATAITFIYDNGVAGDAASDPTNWVFEFDDIEQVASCPSNDALITDFEDDPASYDFGVDGGFGGGAASVIDNPQVDGNNGSAQVGEMLKFAGEVFGGSTLALTTPVDVPPKSVFTMNVWAQREVPVLFKLEGGPVGEVQVTHGGTGWETLNFDFGDVSGNGVTGITLIFDLGVAGDAAGDPGNWTFYFDDIAIGGGG